MSGWLHSLHISRTHATASAATGHGPWRVRCGGRIRMRTIRGPYDAKRVPTSPTAGRRPAGDDLRDENNGASAPGSADHACSVLTLALWGQGAHTPGPPLSSPFISCVSGQNFHIACLHTANPPALDPVSRQSRIHTRQAVRVRRFPVSLRRNRRDDAGQARRCMHRACCLFAVPSERSISGADTHVPAPLCNCGG